jgi:hypothetical protein
MVIKGQSKQIVQETPSAKITRANWTGGVVAVEPLSSNSTPQNK